MALAGLNNACGGGRLARLTGDFDANRALRLTKITPRPRRLDRR
jgi:hypothetical protein